MVPPASISEPNKVQKFQFQTSRILLFRMFGNNKNQKCHNFYRLCYNFWKIYGSFSFFLARQGKQITSHWTLPKGPIRNVDPSEKFLFVEHPKENHNEREFKRQIIGEILDQPRKSSKTREASIISGPQLNIIASILEPLKIFSEVIVASKCGPLAIIAKQAVS